MSFLFLGPFILAIFSFWSLFMVFDDEFFLSWGIGLQSVELDLVFLFDKMTLVFLSMVSAVGSGVLFYSFYYMMGDVFKTKFLITLSIFLLSMMVLCVSADIFTLMIGWDGLGLSSFLLIIFYSNWTSMNNSMVTFLSNRLGDSCIIVSMVYYVGAMSSSFYASTQSWFFLLILICALSKSAQVPFSYWLPLAMAAPTPVSSLVHSSTLVTAGVFLLLRFSNLTEDFKVFVFYVSSLTIFISGLSSIGEYDLKKIIALSTMSHIGLMFMYISLGCKIAAMTHMIIHAFFKALLFMISGNLIHNSGNHQDIRKLGLYSLTTESSMILLISLLSMSGVPFLSGFYSKEVLLELLCSKASIVYLAIFFFSVTLTSVYSSRIMIYLLKNKSTNQLGTLNHLESSSKPIFMIMLWFVMMGALICQELTWQESALSHLFSIKKFMILILVASILLAILLSTKMNYTSLDGFKKMWWIGSANLVYQNQMFKTSFYTLYKLDSKGLLDLILIQMIKYKVLNKMSMLSTLMFINLSLMFMELSIWLCANSLMIHY